MKLALNPQKSKNLNKQVNNKQSSKDKHSNITKMPSPKSNTLAFGVLMLLSQIAIAALNGIFIRPIQQFWVLDFQNTVLQYTTPQAAVQPMIIAMATVLGFGLIFSYNKKLIFTGLGFALFICAFVIQYYPLINAFWTKTQIMGQKIQGITTPSFSKDIWYPYYLNRGSSGNSTNIFESHLIETFKCAISIIVAYSCVIGRVGLLEAFLFVLFGTVGFELNRQVCYRKFQIAVDNFGDGFGTMLVFCFGGFMGLGAALLLSCKQGKPQTATARHPAYTANGFSASYALFGTCILSITLPFLILDWHSNNAATQLWSYYIPIFCVIFSIAGSTFSSIGLGLIFYGRPIVRHLVYGPVAGAVIGGASSYYTSNPVYAFVVGVAGGMLQTIFMSIQQYLVNTKGFRPLTTVSFTLFGIQGLVGSAFAVGWKQIIEKQSNGLPYTALGVNSANLILFGLISAGIGMGFGLIIGVLILLAQGHERKHQFADRTYWLMEDGISDGVIPVEQEGSERYYEGDEIKNMHAYL